jgi:predicted SnoaL-like aldol condensation-catalyzing enzyme
VRGREVLRTSPLGGSRKFALGICGWHHIVQKFAHPREGEEALSAEDNKALVRRFVVEVQSGGKVDLIDEICSPEFVNHSTPPGIPPDREGIKILTAMFRGAFPDSYFTVEDMVAEGDKVATRKTFHGTHEGEFMGIPPSGRAVSMGLIDIVRISDGRVVEHWSMGDTLGMMQQLGVIPQPGQS